MSTKRAKRRTVAVDVPAGGLWAIVFVAMALVALAAVPAYLGNRVEVAQDEINDVLQPASNLSSRLSLLSSRQMARFERYMLSRDGSHLLSYVDAIAEEDSVYARLGDLAANLEFEVRERLAELSAANTQWHLENQRRFNIAEPGPRAAALQTSRATYEQLQEATEELDQAIQEDVLEGRRNMAEARALQTRITFGLAILALGATFVVGLVGVQLRGLTQESQERRMDAVLARREIDALLEATGDGVLGIDLDGNCISLNRAGCELLGYSERDLQGRDFHATLHASREDGSARAREESRILQALRTGHADDSDGVDVLWRRDGSPLPVKWSVRPLVDGTELRGSVLTFSDMTEIRRKEKALHQAIRQREDVVSIVSHDLRNPLGVVFGATDILLELPLDDEGRKQQAEIIGRAAKRMSNLIEDLLDVARIEDGALVVRRSLEDLREIMDESLELFRDQAERKGLCLALDVGEEELPARVDRDRVIQALSNLLDNAVRLTPEGGAVTLRGEGRGGRVAVHVSDTGPGMTPDTLEHVFDRYWQRDDGSRGAAGLGLTIVKGVVDAHNGEIQVSSEVGVGTTFTLLFPAANGENVREGHA